MANETLSLMFQMSFNIIHLSMVTQINESTSQRTPYCCAAYRIILFKAFVSFSFSLTPKPSLSLKTSRDLTRPQDRPEATAFLVV